MHNGMHHANVYIMVYIMLKYALYDYPILIYSILVYVYLVYWVCSICIPLGLFLYYM